MNDLPDLEALKNASHDYVSEIKDATNWQFLKNSAIGHKHTGDLDRAIAEMVKAISLTRTRPNLTEETAMSLNYLADLYLLRNKNEEAEEALRESIALSRPRYPFLLAANLWILAGIQSSKGEIQEALASAEESLQLSQAHDDSYGVAQAKERIESIKAGSPNASRNS